ncbi:FliM/FliN family flagellar motor switch protein [Cysteiniphilum sp. QT6929]|uniref:FliM/FliN family flagellar motor switch protein n=1 Tax=Cysteiniphilum sp. QT6929 TaxID=2975055 RepID=UPI0024B380AE|nr:FliM/FliN family flagellar motor switch protein [Cysteiniphilum sp. QT6929]WHN66106.1 FliM/FliN family flagellar motor switch protein [Cysteiniphilum sp. QT6929]
MSENTVLNNNLTLLDELDVELTAVLGQANLKVKTLLSAKKDTIIALDQPINAPLKLMLNGHCIAEGELVTVAENFAIKITKVADR